MPTTITLLHHVLITAAVEDYAPGYFAELDCACAADDAARYVATYDLPTLIPRYGLKALEHEAQARIRRRPELLRRSAAECAARHAVRRREARRLLAAALAAHHAGDTERAALFLADAELIDPRTDWTGHRAQLVDAPTLAAAG